MVSSEQKQQFETQGFLILRGLFSRQEAGMYLEHYMALRAEGGKPGDFSGVDLNSSDPLKKYPRMIHMHRWDQTSLDWMLDRRIASTLSALLEEEPYGVQTMIYYKPPTARGQALHQDQYYLRVQPGTCIAAWMALERCDEANGCLQVVPGSQNWPLLCTVKADTNRSFTDVTVPVPEGTPVLPMIMEPGDVLFFNGQVVHGSGPNTTSDRFRRSLIGHYVAGDAQEIAKWFHPALRMDGREVVLEESVGGGACGIWVEQNGSPVIELAGVEGQTGRTE